MQHCRHCCFGGELSGASRWISRGVVRKLNGINMCVCAISFQNMKQKVKHLHQVIDINESLSHWVIESLISAIIWWNSCIYCFRRIQVLPICKTFFILPFLLAIFTGGGGFFTNKFTGSSTSDNIQFQFLNSKRRQSKPLYLFQRNSYFVFWNTVAVGRVMQWRDKVAKAMLFSLRDQLQTWQKSEQSTVEMMNESFMEMKTVNFL